MDNLISIIVPVFNTEEFLAQCLESLINQTYRNIEIICINDGSTDSSLHILSEYAKKDNRIKIINQMNKGISSARNTGLLNSCGEFVIFVDSDDWLDRNALEIAYEEMYKENVDLVLWPYKREYENGSFNTELFDSSRKKWNKKDIKILFRMMIGPVNQELIKPENIDRLTTVWGKLYKRSVIKNVRFIDTKKIGTQEDLLYNLNVLNKVESASYISNIYYHYRKTNDKSFTHKYKKYLVDRWSVLYEIIACDFIKFSDNDELKMAFYNRISCSFIGLGLNLAEDKKISFVNKCKELYRILNYDYYNNAMKQLNYKYMPFYWKLFFYLSKRKVVVPLCCLLIGINKIRYLK